MTNITGPTGLIFHEDEPQHLRAADHYRYNDEGLTYIRREIGQDFMDYMENRAFPGTPRTAAEHVLLMTDLDWVREHPHTHLFTVDAGRSEALRQAGIDPGGLRTRGANPSRIVKVEDDEYPKGWRTPALAVKDMSVKQLRKALKQARKAHRADVQTIGREFLAEANRRGLCAEYDTVIQRINGTLEVKMPSRITRVVTVEETASRNVTVTVSSDASEEEVIEAAKAQRPGGTSYAIAV